MTVKTFTKQECVAVPVRHGGDGPTTMEVFCCVHGEWEYVAAIDQCPWLSEPDAEINTALLADYYAG